MSLRNELNLLYAKSVGYVLNYFTSALFHNFFRRYSEQLMELMHARARRRFARGLKRKPMALVKKLRRAKKEAPPNEKPEIVKTHLRNMIIVPEMVGSIVGIYNGKTFNQVRFVYILSDVPSLSPASKRYN